MADVEPLKAAVEPVAEHIHRLIEDEIRRHLEPLERRIAELEHQVGPVVRDEPETPPSSRLGNPEE